MGLAGRALGFLGVDGAVLGRLGDAAALGAPTASRSSSASSSLPRGTTSAGTLPLCRRMWHMLGQDSHMVDCLGSSCVAGCPACARRTVLKQMLFRPQARTFRL